jgi:hypothetical protein
MGRPQYVEIFYPYSADQLRGKGLLSKEPQVAQNFLQEILPIFLIRRATIFPFFQQFFL